MYIKSNHFKRKNIKKYAIENILIFALSIVLIILLVNLSNKDSLNKVKAQVAEEVVNKASDIITDKLTNVTLLAEADITKAVLEATTDISDRYVNQINSEIEYVVLTESGKESISHNRSKESDGLWQKCFDKSNISIGFDYNAILSIKTGDIDITTTDGIIYLNYNLNDIYIKGIDIYNTVSQTDKGVFGKAYSDKEVLAMLDIAKSDLNEQITNDSDIKQKAENNLDKYFIDIANKLNVTKLYINNVAVIERGYTFISLGTIKYNQPNVNLLSNEYLVIHSTAVKNMSALQFYNRLNSAQTDRGTSCHFYVDDINVVQAISTNLKSFNCGINNESNIDNNCTISLEICEFTDPDRQQKAIENASEFVNNILKVRFPNIKVVTHRSVKSTKCPQILSDKQFNELFIKGGE